MDLDIIPSSISTVEHLRSSLALRPVDSQVSSLNHGGDGSFSNGRHFPFSKFQNFGTKMNLSPGDAGHVDISEMLPAIFL